MFLRSSKDNEEVLLWRLAGSFGNIWNKAEIPIYHNYAYEVTTWLVSYVIMAGAMLVIKINIVSRCWEFNFLFSISRKTNVLS